MQTQTVPVPVLLDLPNRALRSPRVSKLLVLVRVLLRLVLVLVRRAALANRNIWWLGVAIAAAASHLRRNLLLLLLVQGEVALLQQIVRVTAPAAIAAVTVSKARAIVG
jgi:hypothetical protein